jgi:general secretion pathway protein K
MAMKSRQGGAALIIVLLLFAVLVALAVEVMYRLDHFRTRTGNLLSWDQRYQYAIAAETLAIQALIDDLENDRKNNSITDDCVNDRWGVTLPPMPYEQAMLNASVQDLQGRFNINWLVTPQPPAYERNPEAIARFEQLLAVILPDPMRASVLAMEMADWIDSNNLVDGIDGAEDGEYRDRRTPNLPAAHESELRALRSFAPEDSGTDLFWSYLTALPPTTRLNVNTAPPVVLDALLSSTVGNAGTQVIVQQREQGAIDSVATLLQMAPFSTLTPEQRTELEGLLSVNSEFFQVMVDVSMDSGISRLVSRIHRPDNAETVVFSRQLVPVLVPLEPPCNSL